MPWLMAAVYDRMMHATERACLARWRSQLLSDLQGRVLEIGGGTGANLEHYPEAVSRLTVAEPDPHMRTKLAHKRDDTHAPPVEAREAFAEALPFENSAFDAVVSTLVLCSVADPRRALAEIRRVLQPGGRFAFLEHVAADPHERPSRRRWQARIEPIWKRFVGNCHLTRETEAAIRASGFEIHWVARESMSKAPAWVRPSVRGVASKTRATSASDRIGDA